MGVATAVGAVRSLAGTISRASMPGAVCAFAFASALSTTEAAAAPNVLIVHADAGFATAQSQLQGTGLFGAVDVFDARFATPSLATLAAYDSVLAYTNVTPQNAVGLGNALADYVDSGGGLVVAAFSYSSPWDIEGRIATSGYAPLVNAGSNADPGGVLNPVVAHPIFTGIDFGALGFFHNGNFAVPGLDSGATLLADNGGATNMIALNAGGDVFSFNLYPGGGVSGNNAELYELFGNALVFAAGVSQVPEPPALLLLAFGLLCAWPAARRLKP